MYDGEDIALEYDGTNIFVARYSHGDQVDQPLAVQRAGVGLFYYQADHQGSIINLTDSSGLVANSYLYDSYGRTLMLSETVPQPYTYTGREFDTESGLYYYRARYYDAQTGRFLSEDPIGFAGNDQNIYRYVLNNPSNYIDPIGLFVFGSGGSGSFGGGTVIDGAGGFVFDSAGNSSGFIYQGVSIGLQLSASAGGTVIVAPFAPTIGDIQGGTIDFNIRLGYQLTISVPLDLNLWNTVLALDFPPGANVGVGVGLGGTQLLGDPETQSLDPCNLSWAICCATEFQNFSDRRKRRENPIHA